MLLDPNPSKVRSRNIMLETDLGRPAAESGTAGTQPEPAPQEAAQPQTSIETGASSKPVAEPLPAQPGLARTPASEEPLFPGRPDAAPPDRAVHARVIAALFSIGFVLWAFYAWRGYGERHAQLGETWYVGGVHLVELTLIKEDAVNLACASDTTKNGLHCAFRGDTRTEYPDSSDEKVLKPYYTVKGEMLFGAGLWSSAAFKQRALPRTRFTAACNYHVVGIMKAASTRWSPKGRFDPLKQSATFGYFTDCVLPE